MFNDAIGNRHEIAKPNARIVSLVPSLTELLFDLELGDQVVGRTSFCIHPKTEIGRIESVGGTKKINTAKLLKLKPDYVLLNIDENPKEMADELTDLDIPLIVTHPLRLSDNRDLYHLFGSIFNQSHQARSLTKNFDQALKSLRQNTFQRAKQRVLYIIWQDPWMAVAADTYIASVLEQMNWHVIHPAGRARYPVFNFSDLDLDQIDQVLFSSEPYSFDARHIAQFSLEFPRHAAKARLIDGEMISWYGSRAIKALNYLAGYSKAIYK